MSLMTLVRLFAALVLGWTLVALGIGAMGGGSPSHPLSVVSRGETPSHGALPELAPRSEGHDLVDLSTGRNSPLHLPEGDRWTIVTVSPWRDRGEDEEVVGRWISRGEGAFCGMGSFRLSDAAVISRVPMEVLPIGRPCGVPGQARTILFPAGDGQLYRCRLPAGEVVAGISLSSEDGAGLTAPEPVTWKVPAPGVGGVFLSDPVWSSDSRLRKWVIVALCQRQKPGPGSELEPSKIWWLEMGDQAESIVAAGRLTVPVGIETKNNDPKEQYPNVAVGPGGRIQLIYLSRRKGQEAARVCAAELHFDAETGRPYVASGRPGCRTVGEGLAMAPLLVSADGTKVFGRDASGRVRTSSLTGHND